jgi:hypothetical protein
MLIIFYITFILLIWFRTNAWVEYTKLLRLNFLSKYKEYEIATTNEPLLEYHTFLHRYYNCFLTRLLTCPICFSTWLGIIFGCFTYLVLFPIYTILGLILYLIIDKLMG